MANQNLNYRPETREMTREALRVFLKNELGLCCGSPEKFCAFLLRFLRCHSAETDEQRSQGFAERDAWIKDEGVLYALLYTFGRYSPDPTGLHSGPQLLEHGVGCGSSWLGDRGRSVLEALEREEADGFRRLLFAEYCEHGFDDDDPEHAVVCGLEDAS